MVRQSEEFRRIVLLFKSFTMSINENMMMMMVAS